MKKYGGRRKEMILLAVIVGYILGIAPFVVPKVVELIQSRVKRDIEAQEDKTTAEIVDEWLNGPQQERVDKVTQQDIYNEYMTGEVTPKGD
jgi:hypothetical protein